MNRRSFLGGLGATLGFTPVKKIANVAQNPTKIVTSPLKKTVSEISEIGTEINKNKRMSRKGLFSGLKKYAIKKAVQNPETVKQGGRKIIGSLGNIRYLDGKKLAVDQYANSKGLKKVPFGWLDSFKSKQKLIYF